MNIKTLLNQAFIIEREIANLKTQMRNVVDMSENITSHLSLVHVKTCGNHDKIGNATAKIIELEDMLIDEYCSMIYAKLAIKNAIASIDDEMQKLILEERYINLKSWEDIVDDNYISKSHVYRIHNSGVKALENMGFFQTNNEKKGEVI